MITLQPYIDGLYLHHAAGILDGLYLHLDSLEVSCWQHILALMHQMLQSPQANCAGLSTAAVVGTGRLLMHAADACADLEQTEQLVGLLVQSYVQPQASGMKKHLAGLPKMTKDQSKCCFCTDNNKHVRSVTRASVF